MAKRAIFPGTFDPFTNGHTDIVRRSLACFDSIIVAVLKNSTKSTLFTEAERVSLIEEEFADLGGAVHVKAFDGLLADFARKEDAHVIIRGLRAVSDYEYEVQMAYMNKHLYKDIETFFLVTEEKNSYISSSLVKQVAELGGDVSSLVPQGVWQALQKKCR